MQPPGLLFTVIVFNCQAANMPRIIQHLKPGIDQKARRIRQLHDGDAGIIRTHGRGHKGEGRLNRCARIAVDAPPCPNAATVRWVSCPTR